MNVKDILNNKQFWRAIKPLFSNKTKSNGKITLVEDERVTTQDEQNAELLNIFFSNAVKFLKISRLSNTNPLAERLSDPTLKAILKYKNHRSIVATRNVNDHFHFHVNEVSVEEGYKKIRKLSTRKSAQSPDILIRVLKENAVIFADYICGSSDEFINKSTFPSILKNTNITPVFKKGYRSFKRTIAV